MNKQAKKIMRVVEYINTQDLCNAKWQVITNIVNAGSYYGVPNNTTNLKPHIAVWVDADEAKDWAAVAIWDEVLFTKEGDTIAIFYF